MTDRPEPAVPPAAEAVDAWARFVGARSAEDFCAGWLALLAGRFPALRAAAFLVESADGQNFVPIAAWPGAATELARLGEVVEQALREQRGVLRRAEADGAWQLAYPVLLERRVVGLVAAEAVGAEPLMQAILREIHWGSAWLVDLFARRELEAATRQRAQLGGVLEALAVALRHGKLQQVLFETSNDLRQRLGAARVAIGLADEASVKVKAFSEAATFESRMPIVKAYAAAMEEAYDGNGPIHVAAAPAGEGQGAAEADAAAARHPAHRALLAEAGASAVLSCPLLHGLRCIGVLTLEKADGQDFGPADHAWLQAFAALFAAVIEQRRAAERSSLRRLAYECRRGLAALMGPRHLVWKAAIALVALTVAILVLVEIDYRVSAKTVIEGEVQQVVAAPFEGFIGASYARAGDTVRQGQELARLDDRDLRVEQARWRSERDQYDNKLREAMANHDLTAVQVVGAQLRQAEAQLALVGEKLARAGLKAPYDGVVVSGDLSQQIGTPVELGKKLFEIAPLQSYRVILQVDEREIRHLQLGQHGKLVVTGIAGEPMAFDVAKLTSVATAQDGRNFFRVEARLSQASPRLRPGMEGVGKVEVGQRRLWWILTHSFTDWLRITLWTWLP